MDHLTQEQAYLAMFAFLMDRYGETQSGQSKAGRVNAKLSDGGFR